MSAAKEAKKPDIKGKRTTEQKKTVVYVGPSIKNVISAGTVYNNGIPETFIQEMDRQPVIKSLLMPVEQLAEARKELARAGSALKTIYDKVITK